LKTSGNFLDAGHYSMNLQSETDTITTVAYRDGWDGSTSPLINTSELAAGFFKSITGIDMAYNYKSREKRFGKLEYKNGRKLKLRMEWSEETKMYTDGSTGEKYYRSPMIAELYENEELTGYFGFQKKSPVSNSKQTADYTFMNSPNYYLDGKIKELLVNLEYDPRTSYLTVKQNDRMLITLVLMNMNPESRSVAGQTLSRNKVFMTSGSLKPNFKNSEWYYLYYDPSITADEMNQYIDAILCLFFGIGKEKS
ncbi:MAG: hypothetical protein ACXWCZ_10365, partial [Flavisolibacter sp.]